MYHHNCTTRMDNSSGLPNGLLVYKVRWTQSAQQESQSEGISFEALVFSTGVSGHTILIYAKLMFMITCFERHYLGFSLMCWPRKASHCAKVNKG